VRALECFFRLFTSAAVHSRRGCFFFARFTSQTPCPLMLCSYSPSDEVLKNRLGNRNLPW
jgi:hypothetical protein